MSGSDLNQLTAQWNTARVLYPTYSALAREFVIDLSPCGDLEAGTETPPRESVEQARQWLGEMDDRIQVHQLRQFLQTSSLITQPLLETLLVHHLQKEEKSPSDRDKIDFLLVQCFSQAAPSRLDDGAVTVEYVAKLLQPVLGPLDAAQPVWLKPVDGVLQAARKARTLNELLHSGILEQGRKLKVQAGENYFQPIAMVTFARMSFLLRRAFFRLMHDDLNAIFDGLRELESKGIQTIDCRRAQFSAEEPILRLRMICQSWKVMFQAEYSSGQPLRMLVDLRAAIDDALGRGAAPVVTAKPPAAKPAIAAPKPVAAARSAGAAAAVTAGKPMVPGAKPAVPGTGIAKGPAPKAPAPKFNMPAEEAPEFEVSGGTEWKPDQQ